MTPNASNQTSPTTGNGTGSAKGDGAAPGRLACITGIAERAKSIDELLAALNPIDDAMFRALAEDEAVLQEILRTTLDDNGLVVVETVPQRAMGVPGARSVAVDVLCETADDELIAVEVQKKKETDPPRRVRFIRSCVDSWVVRQGTKFAEVPKVSAVYICRSDPFKAGLALYHVDKVVRETGQRVDDGTLDVYACATAAAASTGNGDLERLLRYMLDAKGELAGFPALTARVHYFKQTAEGKVEMSDLFDEYMLEAEARGKAEGRAEGIAEGIAEGELVGLAKGVLQSLGNLMTNLGLTADAAMDALGIPQDDRADYLAKLA